MHPPRGASCCRRICYNACCSVLHCDVRYAAPLLDAHAGNRHRMHTIPCTQAHAQHTQTQKYNHTDTDTDTNRHELAIIGALTSSTNTNRHKLGLTGQAAMT